MRISNKDVFIQDQTTPILDVFLSEKLGDVTLSSTAAQGDEVINVEVGHGIVAGNFLEFWEGENSLQVEVNLVVTNAITIAMPIDTDFTTSALIKRVSVGLNINAVSDRFFTFEPLGSPRFDVVRTLAVMTHSTAGDDSRFGNIASGILNGIFARATSEMGMNNLFNARNNGDLRIRGFDLEYPEKAANGVFATSWRRTFGGSEKNGVVIRVGAPNADKIEVVVRDNLSTLITFRIVIQGHQVL